VRTQQAYYERQALLRALAQAPAGIAAGMEVNVDRQKLQLRADELAAGLDGWTGGWFGTQTEGGEPGPVE
jgi:hypothetical protein